MSQSSLSGSSSCDYGGRGINEELGRLRRKTLEGIEQLEAAVRLDKLRVERELNEKRRTYDSLTPTPREPDNAAEMPEQTVKECAAFEEAKASKLEGELYEALLSCKLFRQRAQSLLAEAVQLTRVADQVADSDSDDEGHRIHSHKRRLPGITQHRVCAAKSCRSYRGECEEVKSPSPHQDIHYLKQGLKQRWTLVSRNTK
ncbi:hypothetical protein MTO96_015469 [Rhipicephalus appendiculatus]